VGTSNFAHGLGSFEVKGSSENESLADLSYFVVDNSC